MSRGVRDEMSRYCRVDTSTFCRAGFYFPTDKILAENDYVPAYYIIDIHDLNVVQFFERLDYKQPAVILELNKQKEQISIIAGHPLDIIESNLNDPQGIKLIRNYFAHIRVPELNLPFFYGGLIGYFAYESALPYMKIDYPPLSCTEQFFFMPSEIVVYNASSRTLTVIIWVRTEQFVQETLLQRIEAIVLLAQSCEQQRMNKNIELLPPELPLAQDYEALTGFAQYCAMVDHARRLIADGDIFQVVLSQQWRKFSRASPQEVYSILTNINPSPYMFLLAMPREIILGASPESQVIVDQGRVFNRPIAGTRRLTGDSLKDTELGRELLHDDKERAEHLMLIDLARNDVGQVAVPGSVRVNEMFKLQEYSHVVHMVSTIEGILKPGIDELEAFIACFPAGTLSGAPKRRAMEIIAALEKEARGAYGGAVGFISFNGDVDMGIIIRSAVYRQGFYYIQSGAGIVYDSVPAREYEETLAKARAVMEAIELAEGGKYFAGGN